MFGRLGAPEIILILVVVLLLFGAKRLPDMARSFGQSLRILKSETKAMQKDGADKPQTSVHVAALQPVPDGRHTAPEAAAVTPLTGVEAPEPLTDTCAADAAHEGTGTAHAHPYTA